MSPHEEHEEWLADRKAQGEKREARQLHKKAAKDAAKANLPLPEPEEEKKIPPVNDGSEPISRGEY